MGVFYEFVESAALSELRGELASTGVDIEDGGGEEKGGGRTEG